MATPISADQVDSNPAKGFEPRTPGVEVRRVNLYAALLANNNNNNNKLRIGYGYTDLELIYLLIVNLKPLY